MAATTLPTAALVSAATGADSNMATRMDGAQKSGVLARLLALFVLAFAASAGLNYLQLGNVAAARADVANTARALASAQQEVADQRAIVNLNTESAFKAHQRLRQCLRLQVVAAP